MRIPTIFRKTQDQINHPRMTEETISTLLRTGVCPEGPEYKSITNTHGELTGKLSRLRAANGDPQQNAELKRCEDLVEAYSSILAPIRKVPQEILQHIFVLCLPDNAGPSPANPKAPPLTVSGVCFSWCSTALDTPELWCKLAFAGWQSHDMPQLWLGRAVRGNGIELRYEATPDDIFDITNVSPHVKQLELTVPALKRHTQALLSKPRYGSLQDLTVMVCGYPDIRPTETSLQPLGWAPRLKKLRLDFHSYGFERHHRSMSSLFPWARLTHLRINYLFVGLLPSLLSLCKNLQHGHFRILNYARVYIDHRVSLTPAVLSGLITLSIITDDDNFNPDMFGRVSFPNLTSFMLEETDELSYPEEPCRWTQPDHFFSQVQNLQSLTFTHPPHDLPLLLRNIPLLRDLTIKTHHNIDQVLAAMTLEPNNLGHNILPRLATFHLDGFVRIKASAEYVIPMVRSRLVNVPASYSRLEEFRVDVPKCQRKLLEELQQALSEHPASIIQSSQAQDDEF